MLARLSVVLAIGAWWLAATASAQEVALRMTTVVPETTGVFQGMAVRFADKARALSAGRVEITPYPVGVIAALPQVYDAVDDGLVELGHAPVPLLANRDPAAALFSSFPGGMSADALMHWMYEGGGRELLEQHHREVLGLHPLIVGMATAELFAHSHRPLRTLADFQGLKYRSLGVFAEILTELGATPVSTPQAEIQTALQQRTIDAAEFLSPADNLKLGYNKLARYVVAPGAHLPGGYFVVFMKLATWEALAPELRTALETAAELTTFESFYEKGEDDLAALDVMAETNEITRLEPEVLVTIKRHGRAWAERQARANPGNPWIARVAEAHFRFQDRWDRWRWTRM